jgi:hypothetical protein
MSEPLFCYCLQIADREFLIEVAHDGIIYWDDYQTRRRLRGAEDRYLEMKTLLGDDRARRRLNAEIDEFTVSFPLGPDVLERVREAARLLAEDRWTVTDEEQLDTLLLPLFWSEVNPHLPLPLVPPSRN